MKRIFAAALCAVMILLTLTSCGGRAPEFSEIQGRLEELIEGDLGFENRLVNHFSILAGRIKSSLGIDARKIACV